MRRKQSRTYTPEKQDLDSLFDSAAAVAEVNRLSGRVGKTAAIVNLQTYLAAQRARKKRR